MVLRLWQDLLADYDPAINNKNNTPVTIIASNLEVKTFHGLSLATRKNTYIIQDPPLSEAMEPKIWYAQNKALVAEWIKNKAYENNADFFPQPTTEQILDINGAMEAFKTVKTTWIRSKVCIAPSRFPLYEVLCANCRLIVDAELDWKLKCSGCNVMSPMSIRYKIPVTLTDGENNIRSTLKSPDAEKLTKISAVDFKKLDDEGLAPIDDLTIEIDYTEIITFVKYYDKEIAGQMHRRYVILKTYTLNEMKTGTEEEASINETTVGLASPNNTMEDTGKQIVQAESADENMPKNQFFTPSTKKALEEVAVCYEAKGSSSSTQPSNVKRTITFGTITEDDLNINTQEAQPVKESPKKKNKGEI